MFIAVFGVSMLGWNSLQGSKFQTAVVHEGTAVPAALLVNVLTPNLHAQAIGSSIHAPGGGLNILNGCEGVDALVLLIAAFIAAPLPARARARGMAFGVALVYLLNQARILTLFYVYRHDPSLFATLHGAVAPILVIFILGAYFYIWLSRYAPPKTSDAE